MQPVTKASIFGIRLGSLILAAYWLLIFVGTHLPVLVEFAPDFNDKTKHFVAYFGLASLLCYLTNSSNYVRRFGGIILVCLVYAAFDEITQTLVRGRTADPYDFLADSLGTGLAVILYAGGKYLLESRKRPTLLV